MKKLIKVNSPNAALKACEIMHRGGIIAYPTDTIYGFGCDSKNETAIKKLNNLKKRSGPISVISPDRKTAIDWMTIKINQKSKVQRKMVNGNTVIATVKKNICSNLIMGNGNTLGIRIPKHDFCKKLSSLFPNPITSTSANINGKSPHIRAEDILNEFDDGVDLVIDGGIINGSGSKIFLLDNDIWKQLR